MEVGDSLQSLDWLRHRSRILVITAPSFSSSFHLKLFFSSIVFISSNLHLGIKYYWQSIISFGKSVFSSNAKLLLTKDHYSTYHQVSGFNAKYSGHARRRKFKAAVLLPPGESACS